MARDKFRFLRIARTSALTAFLLIAAACGGDTTDASSDPGTASAPGSTPPTPSGEGADPEQSVMVPNSPEDVNPGMVALIITNDTGSSVTTLTIDEIEATGETVATLTASNSAGDDLSVTADFLDGTVTGTIDGMRVETTQLSENSVGDTGWITIAATATPTDDSATSGSLAITIYGRQATTTDSNAGPGDTTDPDADTAVPTSPDEVAAGHVAFIIDLNGETTATILTLDETSAPGETIASLQASNVLGDTLTIEADFLDGTITADVGGITWETSSLTENTVGDTGWIIVEATAVPTDDATTDVADLRILGRTPGSTG